MGKETGIAWTDHTFNPWWGCTRVSAGCQHCYAETLAARYGTKWGVNAERRFFGENHWREPETWNRAAERAGVRRRVFSGSMCDVFEDRPDLGAARDRLFRLIAGTPMLDWQLLTKRPENIDGMIPEWMRRDWPTNLWLGTSVESDAQIQRALELVSLPGAVHFISAEPLIGPLDLQPWLIAEEEACGAEGFGNRWVIVGGESGTGARGMALDWARRIVRDCREFGVPVFVKQLGRHAMLPSFLRADGHEVPCEHGMRDPKGGNMSEWPEDLRVREFPKVEVL